MSEPYVALDKVVRVYPASRPDGPGLVWAHGGGFTGGNLEMPEADWFSRSLSARGITVVSVDYALAPVPVPAHAAEAPARRRAHHPAGLDDVVAAFRWAVGAGLTTGSWAIGGASAGGNLAAATTLRLLSDGDVLPSLVVLAYPTLLAIQPRPDAALRAALDADPVADHFGPEAVRAMYENYLGGPVGDAPLTAVPGLATAADVSRFPPTLMINGEVDELRVSGEFFARTLAEAGREIVVVTEPGTRHGHLNRPDEPAASLTIDRIVAGLANLTASNPHIDAPVHTSPPLEYVDSRTNAWAHGADTLTAPLTEGSPG